MNTLDVMIPFYGDPERLRQAVASVVSQTSAQWRLVVVDDAHPGPSVREWLMGLADPRVEYHRNPRNLGVNGNFRRCLELSAAPYVTFLGDDDLLLPDYVDVVLKAATDTRADVVQPGVEVMDERGRVVRPLGDRVKARLRPRAESTTVLSGEPLATSLMRGNWAYFPSLAWRRERIARCGFAEGLEVALDLRLLVDLLTEGATMALVPEICFRYRRHAESVSSQTARTVLRFDEEALVMDEAARTFAAQHWPRAAAAARHRLTSRLHAASLVPGALRDDRRSALRLLRHALGG